MIPLTHHDIMTLVGPFSRGGHHVDLAASDRAARRLVFRPTTLAQSEENPFTLIETLALENPREGQFRALRTLSHVSGVTAVLGVEARRPEDAYARLLACAPHTQFEQIEGTVIAYSYRVDLAESETAVLTAAEAQIGAVRLQLSPPTGIRAPTEITLQGADDWRLPEDLLSVLGWAWGPMAWRRDVWRAQLRVPRREPQRSVALRRDCQCTVRHLTRTFAVSPTDFHVRFRRARWRASLQRALPLLVYVGVLASLPLVKLFWFDRGGALPAWALGLPPLLLIGAFFAASYEVPEIVLPSLPRPLDSKAWAIDEHHRIR